MEFNEKLQELRKGRGLTQEELAEELFVSRTAISKWESGRGYPSIDSLKEISQFFSVSIDELISSDEIVTAAEGDKRAFIDTYSSLVCGALDVLLVILLFIPVFGTGTESSMAVSLLSMVSVSSWPMIVFVAIIGASVLVGICEAAVAGLGRPILSRRLLITGMTLSIIGVAVFIAARQPYAGIIFFALLVIKGFLMVKARD